MIDFKNRPIALEFAKYINNEKISSSKLEDLLNKCDEDDVKCLNSGHNEDYIHSLFYYNNFSFKNIMLIIDKRLKYDSLGVYNILKNLSLNDIKKIIDKDPNFISKFIWEIAHEHGNCRCLSDELIKELEARITKNPIYHSVENIKELEARITKNPIYYSVENIKGYYSEEAIRLLRVEKKRRNEIAYYKSLPDKQGEYTQQPKRYDYFKATGYR